MPLFGIQIGIARAHGQAVRFADDRANRDLNREIQVAHHAADDGHLRRIFLSEEGDVGLDDVKQLGHDRGHAAEVAGTRASVELVAQSLDRYPRGLALRIHLVDGRREQNIDALFFQQRAVAFEGARILRQIFRRAELRGVHEDGNGHRVALRFRSAHQRQVALMQRAHGRNQA